MPEEKKDKQDITIEILEEMLKWIKVTSIPQVKKLLLDILPSDKERIAYHFSDGEHGSQEVAQFAGVSFGTITRWWKTWIRAGIAESVGAKGGERARRVFSLEDFGMEMPEAKGIKTEKKEAKIQAEPTKPPEEKLTQEETEGNQNE
jgi:hypothetical protein